MGNDVAKFDKKNILALCAYCSNPARHQTRTLLSGVLGKLEDTCNFHHVTKQDNKYGGGDDHRNAGEWKTGSSKKGASRVSDIEKDTGGLHGAQPHQPHHQPSKGT